MIEITVRESNRKFKISEFYVKEKVVSKSALMVAVDAMDKLELADGEKTIEFEYDGKTYIYDDEKLNYDTAIGFWESYHG